MLTGIHIPLAHAGVHIPLAHTGVLRAGPFLHMKVIEGRTLGRTLW